MPSSPATKVSGPRDVYSANTATTGPKASAGKKSASLGSPPWDRRSFAS